MSRNQNRWLKPEERGAKPVLTVEDLARILRYPEHTELGYKDERDQLKADQRRELDSVVIETANQLGLNKEQLSLWTNSKDARWCTNDAGEGVTELREIVRRYLNAKVMAELRSEFQDSVPVAPVNVAPAPVVEIKKSKTHTLVLHRNPDFEALFMAWLVVTHPRLRSFFNLIELTKLKFKFIPSGPLHAEDWTGEAAVNAPALEKKGYLFLDCGGGGAMLDQHGAAPNVGQKRDVVASVNLLAGQVDLFATDPLYLSFVRVVSENDRSGESVTVKQIFDKTSATPNVPRDVRTMVGALNELYPEDPEQVRQLFFLAMDGLDYLLGEWVMSWEEATDSKLDFATIDLREMNFLTVDNAAVGLEHCLDSRFDQVPEDQREAAIHDIVERFWRGVTKGWQLREESWQQAARDFAGAARYELVPKGWREKVLVVSGASDSKLFAPFARHAIRKANHSAQKENKKAKRRVKDVFNAHLVVQFYGDGRFLISRSTDAISLDRIASYLRRADCVKRRGSMSRIMVGEENRGISPDSLAERNTTSYVEAKGEENPQFYYPGFAFGNRFATNPTGLAVSALTVEEVLEAVKAALEERPLATIWNKK